MVTDEERYEVNELTESILGSAYEVSKVLGSGFLEKVYENALALELRSDGLVVEQQEPLSVVYRSAVVGEYFADLMVERKVIVELKASKALDDIHVAQCLNYLKATHIPVCLLLNFGKPRLEVRRVVLGF